jgi:pimeloyl-ACP methyl ester carboxylesterase
MPYVAVNGARLWFEEEGKGPAVVFVHGGLGDHRLWEPQAHAFAARFRCIEVDSDHYLTLRKPQELADLLLEFLGAAAPAEE